MRNFPFPEEQYVEWMVKILHFMAGCGILIFIALAAIVVLAICVFIYKIFMSARKYYILIRKDGEDDCRVVYHQRF